MAPSAGIGKGSTFTVRLPPAIDSGTKKTPAAPQADCAGCTGVTGLKVLVVDDNADAALTLSMMLEVSGYITQLANSGSQAIEVIKTFKPAVAFLDTGMPGWMATSPPGRFETCHMLNTSCSWH